MEALFRVSVMGVEQRDTEQKVGGMSRSQSKGGCEDIQIYPERFV